MTPIKTKLNKHWFFIDLKGKMLWKFLSNVTSNFFRIACYREPHKNYPMPWLKIVLNYQQCFSSQNIYLCTLKIEIKCISKNYQLKFSS